MSQAFFKLWTTSSLSHRFAQPPVRWASSLRYLFSQLPGRPECVLPPPVPIPHRESRKIDHPCVQLVACAFRPTTAVTQALPWRSPGSTIPVKTMIWYDLCFFILPPLCKLPNSYCDLMFSLTAVSTSQLQKLLLHTLATLATSVVDIMWKLTIRMRP